MKRLLLFLIALCIFIGTVFIGCDNIISALILFICLIVMVLTPTMKYKPVAKFVEELKEEMEEDDELFASGLGILITLGIYFIGMLIPYLLLYFFH